MENNVFEILALDYALLKMEVNMGMIDGVKVCNQEQNK